MENTTMISPDAVSASLAQCYVIIDGSRYNFMQAINLEASVDKNKTQLPILGRVMKGNKGTAMSGTGSASFYYNTPIFRNLLKKYKETGQDLYFDIQVVNDDPSSAAGRQSCTLVGVNLDGGILAKFDADGDYLSEDISFTFEDFEFPESFGMLSGMI
jgi:hypothetical protein